MNAQSIISSFATVNDEGVTTAFDFAEFDKVVSELVSQRALLRKENKDAIKEAKKAANAEVGKLGQKYYDSLAVGDTFTYKNASGEVLEATKIETKSGSGKRASCELVNPPANAKSAKRYPEFHQVVVPEDFVA